MKLTAEQMAQFDQDGYLFMPGLFTPDEATRTEQCCQRSLLTGS